MPVRLIKVMWVRMPTPPPPRARYEWAPLHAENKVSASGISRTSVEVGQKPRPLARPARFEHH